MAYGYNYPYYNPQFPAMPMQQPQQQTGGIQWVQGETGAKAYSVAPGQSAMLMDSEEHRFFIKSVDAAGIPSLRVFDFTERLQQPAQAKTGNESYVTRDEFAALKAAVDALRGGNNDAQSPA